VEWFPDRDTAVAAEFAAIIAEKPKHNIEFNHEVRHCAPDPALQRQSKPRPQRASQNLGATFDQMRDAIATIGRRRP
jgi:hypothetical protein